MGRYHPWHSRDPEGGRKRPGLQNRLGLSRASPPVGEKNVTHQRLLTKPDFWDDSEGSETRGNSPKVMHLLRTELGLQRWGRRAREGHQGLRPWHWRSTETPVTSGLGARTGEGSSFSLGTDRAKSVHARISSRAEAPSVWRHSSSSLSLVFCIVSAETRLCQPCSFILIDH